MNEPTNDLPPRPTREDVEAAISWARGQQRLTPAVDLADEVLHLRAELAAEHDNGQGLSDELEQATARAAAMHAVVERAQRLRALAEAAVAWKAKRDQLHYPRPTVAGPFAGPSSIPEAGVLYDAVEALDGAS